MASTMDDKKVMQQIFSTHSPDASLVVDENALLSIVEDILHHTTPTAFLVRLKPPLVYPSSL